MRLTLRTLLAYLDDTLDPAQAREIGQKVAESHVAQELIERIKKVTRRRGLSVPPDAGPDRMDANTVAEYLDNDLPGDRVTEVEEHALNSDVVLAEVAACHQILALVLGEPAHVPPTARQRMYQLVKGRESVRNRRAVRVGPTFPGEAASAEDVRASRRGMGYRLVGALILGIALGVALWQALAHLRNRPPADPDGTVVADANPKPGPDATPPTKAVDGAAVTTPPAAPADVPKAPDKPVDVPKTVPAAITPPIPTPPALPAPASVERKEVGKFVAKDKALLRRGGDAWAWVAPEMRIGTAAPLMSLPGSAAELVLDSGLVVTLFGNLPEQVNWPVLESAATLHLPPEGFDLDLTLERGRVYVGGAAKPAKVRARFGDQTWDLTLDGEQAEVLLESITNYTGEPFRRDGTGDRPRTQVNLGVLKGKVAVKAGDKSFALTAPAAMEGAAAAKAGLTWDSKAGLRPAPLEMTDVPAYWQKAPARPLSVERARELEAAQKRLATRLADKEKLVDVALEELANEAAPRSKVLALLCQGALDMLPKLVDSLEDPGLPGVRQAAIFALQHFIARQPGHDTQAFEQLVGRLGYSEVQATEAMTLLHGFDDAAAAEPATYDALFTGLRSPRVGLRELALWRLSQLDPDGAARSRYSPGDSEPARERAIADWRRRIPEGKVPPGRVGPQGRLPGRAPVRG